MNTLQLTRGEADSTVQSLAMGEKPDVTYADIGGTLKCLCFRPHFLSSVERSECGRDRCSFDKHQGDYLFTSSLASMFFFWGREC